MLGLIIVLFSSGFTVNADPGDAFPWGSEMPFPWKGIQGTWMTTIGDADAYVIFKVVRTENNSRTLKINIVDAVSCKWIAAGAGYEDGRIVKAIVTNGTMSSKVTVHVFRHSDVRTKMQARANAPVTIMSVSAMNAGAEKETYELVKVSTEMRPTCP